MDTMGLVSNGELVLFVAWAIIGLVSIGLAVKD